MNIGRNALTNYFSRQLTAERKRETFRNRVSNGELFERSRNPATDELTENPARESSRGSSFSANVKALGRDTKAAGFERRAASPE
jgi:hypothetical protein